MLAKVYLRKLTEDGKGNRLGRRGEITSDTRNRVGGGGGGCGGFWLGGGGGVGGR